MSEPRMPKPDLEALLALTGSLRPLPLNDEPSFALASRLSLPQALKRFQPETLTQLSYGIALEELMHRGWEFDNMQQRHELRRLEFEVYREHGFEAEQLLPFYPELAQ